MAPTPPDPDPFAPEGGDAPLAVADDGPGTTEPPGPTGGGHRLIGFARRHRVLTAACIILVPFAVLVGYSIAAALTKPGQESVDARMVQWARDNHLGFAVNWAEDKYYENNQPPSGGTPDQAIGPAAVTPTTPATSPEDSPTTKALPPHLPPPTKVPTPACDTPRAMASGPSTASASASRGGTANALDQTM